MIHSKFLFYNTQYIVPCNNERLNKNFTLQFNDNTQFSSTGLTHKLPNCQLELVLFLPTITF